MADNIHYKTCETHK